MRRGGENGEFGWGNFGEFNWVGFCARDPSSGEGTTEVIP